MPTNCRNVLTIVVALICGLAGLLLGSGPVFAAEMEKAEQAGNIRGEEIGHFIIRVRGKKGRAPSRAGYGRARDYGDLAEPNRGLYRDRLHR